MATGPAIQRINALIAQGLWAQAQAAIKRALAADHGNIDLADFMSFVLNEQGKPAQAEFFARQVLAARPKSSQALHNLGNVVLTLGHFDEALELLDRALSLDPREPRLHVTRAMALLGLHKYGAATHSLRDALASFPEDPKVLNLLGYTLQWMGRVEEGVPLVKRAAALDPTNPVFAEHLASMMSYAPGLSEQEVFQAAVTYGKLEAQRTGPPKAWTPDEVRARLAKGGPIRIGLLSPDLRGHAVAYLIEALIQNADPEQCFIACYSAAHREDETSARLKARAGLWRNVASITMQEAAATIQRDRIEVLIDLAGHTRGSRLIAMALKPAPVQMTYMGFPNTTGLKALDYRIVDSITDPAGDESLAVEKLLRLDPCFLSYTPPRQPPALTPPPSGPDGPITFAAFSAILKLNSPLLSLWSRLLAAIPGSRLKLMHFALSDPLVREDVLARLVSAGARAEQLVLMPPRPAAIDVLAEYQHVDIALDTFPYNGTTTICEAALMGVPMVSLHGRTPPARVARSILTAMGLTDLSARSEDEFVSIATTLANNRPRLAAIRSTLRPRFLSCPICEGPAFARRMTQACAWALEQASQGSGPAPG